MKKRPLSITIISWLFLIFGIVMCILAVIPYFQSGSAGFSSLTAVGWGELTLLFIIRAISTVCGVYMLIGYNWARWLFVVWLVFHIAISIQSSAWVIIGHTLIAIVVIFFLFRPAASAWFRLKGKAGNPAIVG